MEERGLIKGHYKTAAAFTAANAMPVKCASAYFKNFCAKTITIN